MRLLGVAPATLLATACAMTHGPDLAHQLVAADGRSYYIFEPGYRCTGFGPGEPVPSWKDHIEVRDGLLMGWGDRCANQGIPLDGARAKTARFNDDRTQLTVDGKTYTLSDKPEAMLKETQP
jgi:hypothetical protein